MKKLFSTLKSFLIIALLGISIPMALYILQSGKFDFKINALLKDEPQQVFVVDVRGNSAKVIWLTEKEVIGGIKFLDASNKIYFEKTSASFHLIELKDLQPNTSYKFSLFSDGKEYKDSTRIINTGKINDVKQTAALVIGQVFSPDGASIQQKGIVVVQLTNSGKLSQKIPAGINQAGGYQINLAGIFDNEGKAAFNYLAKTDVEVTVYYDVLKPPVSKKFTLDFNTVRQIPNIYLGDVNIDIIPGANGN